jgi:serine protease Do
VGFVRGGKKEETAVTVADRAKLFAARLGQEEESLDDTQPKESKLGLSVRGLTQDIADQLEVPLKGVIVREVKPGSFADDVSLQRGDVILEINKQPVNSEDEFNRVISALKSGQDVVFLVRQRGAGRQDGTVFLAGTLP